MRDTNNEKLKNQILRTVIITLATLVAIGFIIFKIIDINRNKNNVIYEKADELLIGRRMEIERDKLKPVAGNIYISNSGNDMMPLIINIHGGAFIAGDADSLDTQSDRISKNNNAVVFAIDYTLLPPSRMVFFPSSKINYQINEIVDVVKYFKENASKYNIDPNKIIIMGYSAGGHLALAATNKLAKQGESIWAQVIGYGYLRNGIDLFNEIPSEYKKLCSTLLVFTAKDDFISESMREYNDLLVGNSVPVLKLEYPNANHGFLEENNSEYENINELTGRSEEQEKYMIDAENKIKEWILSLD